MKNCLRNRGLIGDVQECPILNRFMHKNHMRYMMEIVSKELGMDEILINLDKPKAFDRG